MAKKKSGLKPPKNLRLLILAVILFMVAVVFLVKIKPRVSPTGVTLPPPPPTPTPILIKADVREPINFPDGLTLEVRDSWIVKSNLEKLGLEVWQGENPAPLNPKKNLLILSLRFENKNKSKSVMYDTRWFSLNDENDYLQVKVVQGTDNQTRLSRYLPQFEMIGWQKNLLPGQTIEGVILFEVNLTSRFYKLIYKSGIAEITIQSPKLINL